MWILIVIQLTAASATARSAMPTLYSGVTFQEFTSRESCENVRALLDKPNVGATSTMALDNVRSGILSTSCQPK